MDTRQAKTLCKSVGWKVAPQLMPRVMERRADGLARRDGSLDVRNLILERSGGVVQSGPFQGMRYLRQSVGSVLAAKLLGAYEAELHDAIEAVCTQTYEAVYDVGCAEGYYAVGLKMRLPGSPTVYAFDTDPYARLLCPELARLNDVHVEVRGFCGPPDIDLLSGRRTLVVSDCEGYEFSLLSGVAPRHLANSDLIVELHGPFERLLEGFRATHDWTVYTETVRDISKYALLADLPESIQGVALDEGRGGPTPWAFLRSRAART